LGVLSTPFRLIVPRELADAMVAQAVAELPNECCGILAGIVDADEAGAIGRVRRHYPLVNAAASPKEF
jgi:proteasome lid subunit RPN8/RPN11